MNEPTVLLIAARDAAIDPVEKLVRRVGGLGLEVVAGLDDAYAYPDWDRVALVLIEHGPGGSTNGVTRLFRMLAASRRPVATVILSDGLDQATEAELLRRGAADCLPRPYDLDRLAYLIEVLTLRARPADAVAPAPRADVNAAGPDDPLVVQARRIAPLDTTVLIRGEPGTGKSRLARLLHDLSPRRRGPFVAIRCVEAVADDFEDLDDPAGPAGGRLAEAAGGTLVLDDVEALSPVAQIALLRWIEAGSREAVGRDRPGPPRPRVVATTRSALAEEVAAGRFRSDLFFRLNVIGLELTPLRLRRDAVTLAVAMAEEMAGRSVTLAPEVARTLEAYEWPGNLEELREVMEAATGGGIRPAVQVEDLPGTLRDSARRSSKDAGPGEGEPEVSATLAQAKREAEYSRIVRALQKHNNNRLRAAGELGISRMTLYKKLHKYGIMGPDGEGRRTRPAGPSGEPDGPDERGRSHLGKSASTLHEKPSSSRTIRG